MHRFAFTVLATFVAALALQGCGHGGPGGPGGPGGGPGSFRMGGPGGPGGPGMGPPEGLQLKVFDLDGDGQLTRDELDRALHIELAKYDTDKSGDLNALEARPLNDQRRAEGGTASPAFDWNADG